VWFSTIYFYLLDCIMWASRCIENRERERERERERGPNKNKPIKTHGTHPRHTRKQAQVFRRATITL
jgi:hypothetical protein